MTDSNVKSKAYRASVCCPRPTFALRVPDLAGTTPQGCRAPAFREACPKDPQCVNAYLAGKPQAALTLSVPTEWGVAPGHRYFYWNDRVVLVEPSGRRVIEIIE
jgi:hypothetical protein